MSAKSDNSRILIRFMPSLSHLASVRVAVPLYLNFNIETLNEAWADIQQENPTAAIEDSENDLLMKYRAKAHLLSIPGHLRKMVLETVKALREEFNRCQIEHPYMGIDKLPFCLRYDGTMDRDKMARQVVANESICIRKRFHLACVYNMRKCMWTLWKEMLASGNRRNVEMARTFFRIRKQDGLATAGLEFPIFENDPEIWFPRMKSVLPGIKSEDRWKLFSCFHLATDDDFLHTLYSVSKEEEEQMLKIHCKSALRLHLEWPRQSLFLETADKLWNFIDVESFRFLLKCIFVQKAQKEDYDYGKILEDFWNKSPDHLKEGAKEDQNLRRIINSYFNGLREKRNADEGGRRSSRKKKRRLVEVKV
ncbi:unnamed protein product [Larinioides sclopetarius]|uniref:Uncharacterized protein n=1 Tax=Larinioides sclopetarius TaxID=280406 RepID=A0AAV1YWD8_9ARAC